MERYKSIIKKKVEEAKDPKKKLESFIKKLTEMAKNYVENIDPKKAEEAAIDYIDECLNEDEFLDWLDPVSHVYAKK